VRRHGLYPGAAGALADGHLPRRHRDLGRRGRRYLRRWTGFLFAVAAPAAPADVAGAQANPSASKFIGRVVGVYDNQTGQPIDSAEVRDMATGLSALTTSTGTLSLFFVDTAGSLIRIRKIGYTPVTMFAPNAPGEPPLTVTLAPIATALPKVVVSEAAPTYIGPQLKAFEQRRKEGMGYFVPESVIRNEEERTLGNIVHSHVPSLTVSQGRLGSAIAYSRRMGKLCAVDVFLDGVLQSKALADLNQYQPSMIAGIEFHNPGDMPPEFNRTGSGCGALFLWTREK
jgi:hypothetical protein